MEPNLSLDRGGGEPAAPPRESTHKGWGKLKRTLKINYLKKISNFSIPFFLIPRRSFGGSPSPYIGEGVGDPLVGLIHDPHGQFQRHTHEWPTNQT